jgi:hypothetical protein
LGGDETGFQVVAEETPDLLFEDVIVQSHIPPVVGVGSVGRIAEKGGVWEMKKTPLDRWSPLSSGI